MIQKLDRGPSPVPPPVPETRAMSSESYLDEASFVLNPLSGRLPPSRKEPQTLEASHHVPSLALADTTLQDVLLVEAVSYTHLTLPTKA